MGTSIIRNLKVHCIPQSKDEIGIDGIVPMTAHRETKFNDPSSEGKGIQEY